jgi:D-glutamate cyclase
MIDFAQLEATIRRDPGERGLASYRDADGKWLCAGHLEKTANELAQGRRGCVLIATGFCILTEEGPKAETDGPPGAIYLADRLRQSGYDVVIVTDRYAAPLVRAGFDAAGMTTPILLECPIGANSDEVREEIASSCGAFAISEHLSHRIAIERVGPSHDAASVEVDQRDMFLSKVASEHRGVCHNMRGVSLDQYTAPLHVLFENDWKMFGYGPPRPRPTTIGIVDGGNEIGCGGILWSVLRQAIKQGPADRIACRVRTDATIIAGVSNWGAYALGAALTAMTGGRDAVDTWTADRLRAVIETMVRDAGAVDGATKLHEATVDGQPLDVELAMLDEIHSGVRGG